MPVGEFPGSRNWGYDGVHLYAPQSTYGGPRGLRRLVDAAHGSGLSVVLDVVYNHLGPEGNYLARVRPVLHGPLQDALGHRDQLRRPRQRGRSPSLRRERPVLGPRVPRRRPPAGRHPLDLRHEPGPHPDRAGRGGPRGSPAARADRCTSSRSRTTTTGASSCLPRRAASASTPSGRTTSTTPSTAGSPASAAATTSTSPTARAWRGRWPKGFAYQGEPSEYFGRPRGTPSTDLGGERFVHLPAEPRPGRQSRAGRPAVDHRADGRGQDGRRAAVRRAGAAAALHGRGVRRDLAVSVLHLVSSIRRWSRPCASAAPRSSAASAGRRAPPDPGESATFLRSRLNHSLAGAPRHRELREYYRHWLALRRTHPALGARGKERARCELDAEGSVLTLTREAPDGDARLPGRQPHQHRAALRAALRRMARDLLDSEDPRFAGGGMRPAAGPLPGRPVRSQPAGVIAS